MDIDVYQQCPCHSEKKIKFCCGKDIVADLNQILAKNSAGQGLAALDQLERTIKKTGPRDCLLTIQTHILIAHGEIEKARQSNELFLEKNSKHATGLHHRALIQLGEGDTAGAVESLQDAMDSITGNEIPLSMAAAFRMIGIGLLQEGHVVGSRAHFRFAQYLKNEQDPELAHMILETFRIPDMSLLLKQTFGVLRVDDATADSEWAKKYLNVHRAIDRGQFRKALKFLKKIDANFPVQPIVVRGIAVLNMQLGYESEIASAWRRYSLLDGISQLEAIEAEALAQLFDEGPETEEFEIVRVTFELADFSAALEKALSSSRLTSVNDVADDPFDEGPAPRNGFYLLDQKQVTASELNLENVSNVTSELLLYGRQTDRPARLEWVAVKSGHFAADKQFLLDTFGDCIAGQPQESAIGAVSAVVDAMTWNWSLPRGVTPGQHTALVKQKCRDVLLQNWARIRFSVLDQKTPEEAAKFPEYQLPLQAMLVKMELAPGGQFQNAEAINELRAVLGLPEPASIELADLPPRPASPLEQQYLRIDHLTDDQLRQLQYELISISSIGVLRRVVEEMLARPEITNPTRDLSYSLMAQLTQDPDEGLEYLAQARSEARKLGRPIGVYLVQEFEFRLVHGLTEKLPALMQTIQLHHLKEPDVEYQLARVLERHGLLRGRPNEGEAAEAGDVSPADLAGIAAGDASESQPKEPSKLWIPD